MRKSNCRIGKKRKIDLYLFNWPQWSQMSQKMETNRFKKIIHEALSDSGFSGKGSPYYREGSDCFCVIGLQRSGYSAGYYLCVGFFLKGLHEIDKKAKYYQADIQRRLLLEENGRKTDFFDLEKLSDGDEQLIKESVSNGVQKYIEPALKVNGIRPLLDLYPSLLNQTTLAAKKYLGIDE